MPLTRFDQNIYERISGGTQTSAWHFFFASHMASPVFTPKAFAFSFFASTMPRLSSRLPHTASGTAASAGFFRYSTEA